jgi:hypothetical protein
MDYEELAEIAQMMAHWEKAVVAAKMRIAQAEADLCNAEKNLAGYKRRLDKLLQEGSE